MMNTTMTAATMTEKLTAFVAAAQAVVDAHYAANFQGRQGAKLTVEMGKRYARIVTTSIGGGANRSVYCFVDMTNGNVLKAASWKAPAKGARGSILADNNVAGVTAHGGRYR